VVWLLTVLSLTLLSLAAGCGRPPEAAPPVSLTIVTGGPGGSFYPLGLELSRLYTRRVPGVTTRIETGGSGENVQAIEDGHAQMAFSQADVAYTAYRRGTDARPQPHTQLRGIAVLWQNTLQLLVPRTSPVREPSGLQGRHVSVGTRGSGSETLSRIVLESYGLSYGDIQPEFTGFQRTVDAMRDGTLEAAIVSAGVPTAAIAELSERPGVRLLPIPRAHVRTMRAQYPFLQPLVVPRSTYPGVDEDVETVGVSILLTCRRDLDEHLVYQLTKIFFEALPSLGDRLPVAHLIDLDQAPATPIPLHPGAARYYREREIRQ
jgi:TRAP transporter TAXI family solute receptor